MLVPILQIHSEVEGNEVDWGGILVNQQFQESLPGKVCPKAEIYDRVDPLPMSPRLEVYKPEAVDSWERVSTCDVFNDIT